MAQRSSSRKPRNSGASRRGSAKKGGSVPGWVWLVTGILAGLFVAFLVFLGRLDSPSLKSASDDKEKPGKESVARQESEKKRPAKESHKPSGKGTSPGAATSTTPAKEKVADAPAKPAVSAKKPEEPKTKPTVNYDFYKILPQYEVVVPEEDPHKPATAPASPPPPGTYYLQVGSFRQISEADGRKAELAMLGIVASIQTITSEPGNTWHRVRIGPVKDIRQLDRTKQQLQDNHISFVTIKEKI